MGLLLLRKGSQRFIGPVFTLFDPPKCVIIVKGNSEQLQVNMQLTQAIFKNRCNNNYF